MIQLYEQKNRKRRRILFDLFSQTIQLNTTRSFIAEMINKELGIPSMVSEADIKYCRHYFSGKTKPKPMALSQPINPPKMEVIPQVNLDDLDWSDPDDKKFQSNKFIKSKFLK